MKKRILVLCLLFLSVFSVLFLYHFRVETDLRTQLPAEGTAFSHDLFDQVLQEHVDEDGQSQLYKTEGEPRKTGGVFRFIGCRETYRMVIQRTTDILDQCLQRPRHQRHH